MEQRTIPAAGEFYRHFKGNLYQVMGVAKHSETGEAMVVYQALYDDFGWYVRPMDMFFSPVDKEKYPEAEQKYRFEKIEREALLKQDKRRELSVHGDSSGAIRNVGMKELKVEDTVSQWNPQASSEESEVREEILRFLDAEGAEEKLKVLREIRNKMDENLLTTMELSLDLLPDEKETMERRIDLIERTLEQKLRFEGGRLR